MKFLKYFIFILIFVMPFKSFAQTVTQSEIDFLETDISNNSSEVYGIYDLRDRKSFIQLTVAEDPNMNMDRLCAHIQIFQQDENCDELDFEDEFTINDTVIYDLDNLIRNDGSEVPVSLDDNSYGYVAISAFNCEDRDNTGDTQLLLGNFRIIDDSGYEYRMNLLNQNNGDLIDDFQDDEPIVQRSNIIIPFNTVDGANQADIYAFVVLPNRTLDGATVSSDSVYNEEVGVTFDIFQIDENEERLSCDRKTIGCGPNIAFNYGINDDYPGTKTENLFCEGGGLLPGQTHGYLSLENVSMISPLNTTSAFDFGCVYGLNNGNGTGSMDQCLVKCLFGTDSNGDCLPPPPP